MMDGGNGDRVFLPTASFEAELVSPSCPHTGAISSVSYPGCMVRNAEAQREVGEPAAMLQVHTTHQGCACATLASVSGFQTCSVRAETLIPREHDCRSLSAWAVHRTSRGCRLAQSSVYISPSRTDSKTCVVSVGTALAAREMGEQGKGSGAACLGVLLHYLLLQRQEWEEGSTQGCLPRVVNLQGRANANCLCHGLKLSSSRH